MRAARAPPVRPVPLTRVRGRRAQLSTSVTCLSLMRGEEEHAGGAEAATEERARQRRERIEQSAGLRQTLAHYRQRHRSMGDEALVKDLERAKLGDHAAAAGV